MKVRLGRVRIQLEDIEVPEECRLCGAALTEHPTAVIRWAVGDALSVGKLGTTHFAPIPSKPASKTEHCVRELRCATCGGEVASLPVRVLEPKETAAPLKEVSAA
jgi:ferredoxin